MSQYKRYLARVWLPHWNISQCTPRFMPWRDCHGFTIIELLITMAIVATLAGIAAPIFGTYVDKARSAKAVSDIRTTLEAGIMLYKVANDDVLPLSLADISRGGILDPWGRTYEYLNIAVAGTGKARKEYGTVPLNTDFDIYSVGKDGKSATPLTASMSRDDIIRANNGGYIGLASDY